MAMNFWEAQARARRYTFFYLAIFFLLTIIIAIGLELALRFFSEGNYEPPEPILGIGFVIVTVAVALMNYLRYKDQGGRYVAESVQGREIDPYTSDPKERQLLNIVQEVAIASALPAPPVYLIEANEINAFAAGLTPDDAVIAVTRGTLERLDRDEIQGVIAHEFGHVSNGDMKINLRLAAMIMGFYFIFYMGMRLMRFSSFGSDDGGRRVGGPMALIAFLLFLAGSITWFAGSILQSLVSRQREYLADASSVQYTRNPDGLANALRKILYYQDHDMPRSGMAFSHLYFNEFSVWNWMFATHPPLEERIAAIEGRPFE